MLSRQKHHQGCKLTETLRFQHRKTASSHVGSNTHFPNHRRSRTNLFLTFGDWVVVFQKVNMAFGSYTAMIAWSSICLCCLSVHSVASLSILLSPCIFCCVFVHSVIFLSVLWSPCLFPILTEKGPRREVEFAGQLSVFGAWSSQASKFTIEITYSYSTRYVLYAPKIIPS